MAKRKPPISVIVTVLNEADSIEQLLEALAQQTYQPAEVVIVDGGSTDQTWQILRQQRKNFPVPLVLRQQPGNRSIGRNTAMRLAEYSLVAITDAGCFPEPTWLAELVASLPVPLPEKCVVAGYYTAYPLSRFAEAVVPYALVMPDRVNPATFLPATRSMLLSKAVWKELKGFNAQLSDNEDYAFAKAIQAAGVPIIFAANARVVWQPPTSLKTFGWMIFRFARGDFFAGIFRPKVLFVFARYIGWLFLVLISVWTRYFAVATFLFYLGWSIKKNFRYAKRGWFWLPVLQVTADIMVVAGSIRGLILRQQQKVDLGK